MILKYIYTWKMKKILLSIGIFFWYIPLLFALNLEVKSNIPSWTYQFPIDIYLISNDKDAKIFYYTDGEWRMDNIHEFIQPLFIKENTTLDFYATNKNHEDTLIQTSTYIFEYSTKIDIWE